MSYSVRGLKNLCSSGSISMGGNSYVLKFKKLKVIQYFRISSRISQAITQNSNILNSHSRKIYICYLK